jgi:hypothetical protein
MENTLRAIEISGRIDEKQQLYLDKPLPSTVPGRVRVIILFHVEEDIPEDEWLRAAATNNAFDFLEDSREDIYTISDGKPFYDPR